MMYGYGLFQSLAIMKGSVDQQTNHLSYRAVDNGTDGLVKGKILWTVYHTMNMPKTSVKHLFLAWLQEKISSIPLFWYVSGHM
jgi:hypothetical protein